MKAPTGTQLVRLVQGIAKRVGRFLERQGLLQRDAQNSFLTEAALGEGPMDQLAGHSITYRIALGPQAGRKVFALQTLPACDPSNRLGDSLGKVAGFSLHAGVAVKAHERRKLERLCRYVSRPAVSEKRLSLTPKGNVRYQIKTPYQDQRRVFDAGDDPHRPAAGRETLGLSALRNRNPAGIEGWEGPSSI